MTKRLHITQIRSEIGCPLRQKATIKALGCRHPGHTVVHEDSPSVRGMIRRVRHLVTVREMVGEN